MHVAATVRSFITIVWGRPCSVGSRAALERKPLSPCKAWIGSGKNGAGSRDECCYWGNGLRRNVPIRPLLFPRCFRVITDLGTRVKQSLCQTEPRYGVVFPAQFCGRLAS